jgi:hypothetical protein
MKEKMSSQSSLYYKTIALLVFIIRVIYFPLINSSTPIANKDSYILDNLRDVNTLEDYIRDFKSGKIKDLQPVKDISLRLDIYLESFFGEKIYLYSNILIWLGICLAILNILLLYERKFSNLVFWFFLIVTHPIYVQSVSWISARKHLISFFLILICMNLFLRGKRDIKTKVITTILFTAALLSHPLPVLWSLWTVIYLVLIKERPLLKSLIAQAHLLTVSLFIGLSNIYYVSGHLKAIGHEHYLEQDLWSDKILSIGRYFAQYLIPIQYSSFYDKGSLLNLIGMIGSVLFIYLLLKYFEKKKVITYLSLFFLGLFPVTYKMTVIFVSDTYMLLPSLAFCLLLADSKYFKVDLSNYLKSALVLLILLFTYRSHIEASFFQSNIVYLKNSYEKEKSCRNMYFLSLLYFKNGEAVEGARIGEDFITKKCVNLNLNLNGEVQSLIVKSLVFSKGEKLEGKEAYLLKLSKRSSYNKLALATYYLLNQNEKFAFSTLNKIIGDPKQPKISSDDLFLSQFYLYCRPRKRAVCTNLLDY